MELRDFFLQSVGPFYGTKKFSFKEGINVFSGGNGSGKTTLAYSFFSILDDELCLKEKKRLKPWVPQDSPSRAGIVFSRNDRIFKLIRDIESLGIVLQEKKSGKFIAVAKGKEVEDFLVDELDFPLPSDFRALLFFHEDISLKSKSPSQMEEASFASSFDGFEDNAVPVTSPMGGSKEERLKILKEELERAEKIEELEFKLEGLEQREFELNEKASEIEKIQQEIDKINQFLSKNSEMQNFPLDFREKLEKIDEIKREIEDQKTEFEEFKDEVESEIAQIRGSFKKYQKDPLFVSGSLIALLGFLLPNVTYLPGWLVFFGLGGIAFLVYLMLIMYSQKEGAIKKKEEEGKRKILEKKKILEGKKKELTLLQELTDAVGMKDPKEVGKMIEKFWKLVEKKRSLEKEIEERKKMVGYDVIEQKREELRKEIEGINNELQDLGRPTMDINTIRQEIARLEGGSADVAPTAGFQEGFGIGGLPSEEREGSLQPSFIQEILEKGEKLSRRTREQFIAGIEDRFEKYLTFVSAKRFVKPEIKDDYSLYFLFAPSDREVRWDMLSEGDVFIIYFSLLASIVDVVALSRNLPFIIDNSFSPVDDKTLMLILKVLKKVSEKVQVILFSRKEAVLKAANNVIRLELPDASF